MTASKPETETERLAKAWADGYKACNTEWEQCWDLVTPDEDRFSAVNPFLNKQQTL